MFRIRTAVLGLAALAVSACGSMDIVTRGAPFENTMPVAEVPAEPAPAFDEIPDVVTRAADDLPLLPSAPAPAASTATAYNIVKVVIDVPRSLKVSESNGILPNADIVWQEEARGDRYEQVSAIFQEALDVATAGMKDGPEAELHVTVHKFHALTRTARRTVGGAHELIYDLALIDPATGAVLYARNGVDATFAAYGGAAALVAENAGLTQRVRITQQLIKVTYAELSPETLGNRVASAN